MMFSGIAWREGLIPNLCVQQYRTGPREHALFIYCCLAQDVRFHFLLPFWPFHRLGRMIAFAAPTCTLWDRDSWHDRLVFRPWRKIAISGLTLCQLGVRL